jgi:hypothetical protein
MNSPAVSITLCFSKYLGRRFVMIYMDLYIFAENLGRPKDGEYE